MPTLQNPQLEAFAQHYAIYRHGRKAMAAAGLDASYLPHALLNRREVKERVRELWGEAVEGSGVSAERVIRELCAVAFSDIRNCYDDNGNLLSPHEFDDEAAAAVSGIDVETRWERDGDNAVPITVKKLRRFDKMAALTILAKHVKVIGDESDGVNALASALADRLKAARRRTAGEVEDARIIDRPPSTLMAPITAAAVVPQEPQDEILW